MSFKEPTFQEGPPIESGSARGPRKRTREESEPIVRQLFEQVELDAERVNPLILDRQILLDQLSSFVDDERRCLALADRVFAFADAQEHPWTDREKRLVLKGTFLSDVGKTGPKDARPDQTELIVKMFAINNVSDPNHRTVEQFLREEYARNYPEDDVELALRAFQELGLSPEMTIREFYNKHALWTTEIINHDGVGSDVVAVASLHHILEGVNPEGFLRDDGTLYNAGGNMLFDRPEKLVIILDKYDAAHERGHKAHAEAIGYLREYIGKSERFANDDEFRDLIALVDQSLA